MVRRPPVSQRHCERLGLRDGWYPIEATALTDTAGFQDFSWGHGYEGEMPLDTPRRK
ncbi:hypothetical protein ACH4Y0_02240 [Streptomyces sp. NPDC020707]|uniref:hypothetical protein n=1 Tax=Streptomyces sp. NPDC020707 TaxID=3365084 RepID=UPI0037B5C141